MFRFISSRNFNRVNTGKLFVPLGDNKLDEVDRGVLSYLYRVCSYAGSTSQLFALSNLGKSLCIGLLASLNYYLFGYHHQMRNEKGTYLLKPRTSPRKQRWAIPAEAGFLEGIGPSSSRMYQGSSNPAHFLGRISHQMKWHTLLPL